LPEPAPAASQARELEELPMTDITTEPSVLSEVAHGVGRIVLNRPRVLNVLDPEMIAAIAAALEAWRDDPAVRLVTIEGAGGRAFCAGGNVRLIRDSVLRGDAAASEAFFASEYRVNRMIAEYPKPYVALIDGLSMGGGMGLSVHGSHRVVTEHAVMAMPETAIALFPDVGGSYFLPRLPGRIGLYLALTGPRVAPGDALYTGLATHYVPRAALQALRADLVRSGVAALAAHAHPAPESLLARDRAAIDRCFAGDDVRAILRALAAEGTEWADRTLETLRQMSPTSLCVTAELLRRGATMTLPECLEMELRLTRGVIRHPDFAEGVRAQVIDKTRDPKWQPPRVEDVSCEAVLALFEGR
jgi:enoyl-CoA hydratase